MSAATRTGGSDPRHGAVFAAVAGTLAAAGLLAGAGYWLAAAFGGAGGVSVLLWATLAGGLGSLAGNLPAALALDGPPQRFVGAFLLGLTLRFAVTLGVALAVSRLNEALPFGAFMLTVGLAQTLYLAMDTGLLAYRTQAATRAAG